MPSLKIPLFAALSLILLAPSREARADAYNRQIVPLGERAAYLGNTGTGESADTGAVYYNPSGLAWIDAPKLSVSGSVYFVFRINTDAVALIDNTPVPYEASGFNTIPASYVATFVKDDWKLAFSVLVPDSNQTENRADIATPLRTGKILVSSRYNDLWIGGSAARKLNDQWSIGATLFAISHAETGITTMVLDTPGTANTTATAMTRSDLSVFGFSLVGGIQYRPSSAVSLGARVQLPLVKVSGKADTNSITRAVNSGTLTSVDEDLKGTPAAYQMPLDATLGSVFHLSPIFDYLLDVSFQFGTSYQSIPASTLSNTVETSLTPRLNTGLELRALPSLPIRFGLFYQPSGLHAIKEGVTDTQTRLNILGLTGGLAFLTEHVETGVGAFYLRGTGENNSTGVLADTTKYSASGWGAILTTAYKF